MQKKAVSPRGTGRGRRLALAAIAAAVLAAAGATAIYAIHRTMPGPEQDGVPVLRERTAPDQAARAGSQAGGDVPAGSRHQEPPAGASGPATIVPPLPPVSLRPPGETEARTAAEASGRPPRAPGPQAQASGSTAPPARPQSPAAPPAASVPPAANAPAASVAGPATAGAAARPRRLDDEQRSACANEGALSRMICNERVRLRFCRDAWNSHPDCMVAPPRGEP